MNTIVNIFDNFTIYNLTIYLAGGDACAPGQAGGIKNSAGNTSSKGCVACIIKPQALCAQTNNRPINYYRYRIGYPTYYEANYRNRYRTCYQAYYQAPQG